MNTLIKLKSLFKYGNGYRLEYFNEEGKLKTKKLKAKTKEEAQTMATNLLLELNVNLIEEKHLTEQKQLENKYSGVRRHVIGTEIVNTYRLLLDVFDEFFMLKQHLSKRSFDDYKRLKDLLYKYNFRWEQLEISNLIKFQKGLENTLSHHYICNHMKLFMVFIKYCYECNHISNNTYGTVCMNIFRHERMKKHPLYPKMYITI